MINRAFFASLGGAVALSLLAQVQANQTQETDMSKPEWVDVADEPQHFHRFENDYARVYDVRFAAGEKSLYHRHSQDTFYVAVHATKVYDQMLGAEQGLEHDLPAGFSMCRGHLGEPLIHQVSNTGEGPMRMIGAEVRKRPAVTTEAPLQAPHHELAPNMFDVDRVRMYRIKLAPGMSTGEIRYGFSALTVVLSQSSLKIDEATGGSQIVSYEPGDHVWRDGPTPLTLTNVGDTPFEAVMGEWR